jgi:hypothetical protein
VRAMRKERTVVMSMTAPRGGMCGTRVEIE